MSPDRENIGLDLVVQPVGQATKAPYLIHLDVSSSIHLFEFADTNDYGRSECFLLLRNRIGRYA